MLNVIIGEKGTGKTAKLIEAVHTAQKAATGSVVFINKGKRLLLNLSHDVRLVDTEEYGVSNYKEFFGFICGILSQNYDIAHIFIDSITKIVDDSMDEFEKFLERIHAVAEANNAEIQIILSINPDEVSAGIKKYVK